MHQKANNIRHFLAIYALIRKYQEKFLQAGVIHIIIPEQYS